MRAFFIWLVGTLAAFAALAGGYHQMLAESPRKILVVVDSSFAMTEEWHRVPAVLRDIEGARYSLFGLASEKSSLHGWSARLQLGTLVPYGPRDFEKLRAGRIAEIGQADEVVFVTNAPSDELGSLDGWQVLRP